jgi:excisionase family DNA binding protein
MTRDRTYLRVPEAADYLGVSRSKLYLMMDAGELAYVKLGKCRRIAHAALLDLVARHTVTAHANTDG